MNDKNKIDESIRMLLLTALAFGITFTCVILLMGLVMGKSLPEIFDLTTNVVVFMWSTIRNILGEFMYDIIGG